MRLVAESRSAAIFPRTFSHPPGEPWVKAFSDPLAKPLIRGVRQQRNRLLVDASSLTPGRAFASIIPAGGNATPWLGLS